MDRDGQWTVEIADGLEGSVGEGLLGGAERNDGFDS